MQVLYNFCKIISLIIRDNSRRAVLFQWLWKWQNKIILAYMTLISAALSLISSHNAQILGNKKAGAKNARRNSSPWLWHCRKTRNLFSMNFYLNIKKVFEIRFDLVATQGSSFQTFINKKVQVKKGWFPISVGLVKDWPYSEGTELGRWKKPVVVFMIQHIIIKWWRALRHIGKSSRMHVRPLSNLLSKLSRMCVIHLNFHPFSHTQCSVETNFLKGILNKFNPLA